MWHVKPAIDRTLQCSKDTRTCRCAHKPNVQVATEGPWLAIDALYLILSSIHVLRASVDGIQLELLQKLQHTRWTSVDSIYAVCSVGSQNKGQ